MAMPQVNCNAIYSSGKNIGSPCKNKAKYLVTIDGVDIQRCGIHSRKYKKIALEPTVSCENFTKESSDYTSLHLSKDQNKIGYRSRKESTKESPVLTYLDKCKDQNIVGYGSCAVVYCITYNDTKYIYKKFTSNAKYCTIKRELDSMERFKSPYIVTPIVGDENGLIMELGVPLTNIKIKTSEVARKYY